MDPRIEDLLIARAIEENDAKPSIAEAAGLGAVPGAATGAILGSVPHSIGRGLNSAKDRMAQSLGMTRDGLPMSVSIGNRMKPGYRMAGSLVGTILGGGLGIGTRQMAIESSPTARLLGKIQSGQEVTEADRRQLAALLEDTYSSIGLR